MHVFTHVHVCLGRPEDGGRPSGSGSHELLGVGNSGLLQEKSSQPSFCGFAVQGTLQKQADEVQRYVVCSQLYSHHCLVVAYFCYPRGYTARHQPFIPHYFLTPAFFSH